MKGSRDIILQTSDLNAAIRFYGTVLQLPITHQSEHLVGFETGSFCLYVEVGSSPGPVFEFYVADLQAAKQALLATGCRILEDDPAVPRCYMRDPFGLVFNLAEEGKDESTENEPA